MAFFLTRIQVIDYGTWKAQFDQDEPGARCMAKGCRIFRCEDDPNEVYLLVEFQSAKDANEGRARLLQSGVLNRFADVTLPRVIEQAAAMGY
jgi:hypothetical protein